MSQPFCQNLKEFVVENHVRLSFMCLLIIGLSSLAYGINLLVKGTPVPEEKIFSCDNVTAKQFHNDMSARVFYRSLLQACVSLGSCHNVTTATLQQLCQLPCQMLFRELDRDAVVLLRTCGASAEQGRSVEFIVFSSIFIMILWLISVSARDGFCFNVSSLIRSMQKWFCLSADERMMLDPSQHYV